MKPRRSIPIHKPASALKRHIERTMCTVTNLTEYRNNKAEPVTEGAWLRSELFFDQAEALFKPVALYIRAKLKEKHGLNTTSSYSIEDGEYYADPLQCWAYGLLTITGQDGRAWMVCCSVNARDHNQRCSFIGDMCTIEGVTLEDNLEWICAALLNDAEAKLVA